MREILTKDWKPADVMSHSNDFIRWVDSINSGFKNRIAFAPYNLYNEQAENWLNEGDTIDNYDSDASQLEFVEKEIMRFRDNSLYFISKELRIKEGDASSGLWRFNAWESQKITMYLFDCMYNLFIGKGRQIGETTILGGCAIKRAAYIKNYFIKFITHST